MKDADKYMLPFTPIGKFVAVRVHRITETKAGIVLPDSSPDDPYQTPSATVLAVGPDVKQVKVGDVVLTPYLHARLGRRGGHEFLIINEEHLLGIWKEV
jgi:co-chaperonin GroES (HSP10)